MPLLTKRKLNFNQSQLSNDNERGRRRSHQPQLAHLDKIHKMKNGKMKCLPALTGTAAARYTQL